MADHATNGGNLTSIKFILGRMQNDFTDQPVPPEKCLDLCRKILVCLDEVAVDRPTQSDRLQVAGAHLQTVMDLLEELRASDTAAD